MEALEHSAVAIRGMFRAVVDSAEGEWLQDDSAHDVLLGLAQTWRELADGLDTFGQLVRDEAQPGSALGSGDVDRLREALEGMHEARARLEEALVSGVPPALLELHAVLLSTVKRVLHEMDLDERIRRQVRLRRRTRSRRVPAAGRHAPVDPQPLDPTPDAETQVLPAVPREPREGPGR
jgi:hypothetical protein